MKNKKVVIGIAIVLIIIIAIVAVILLTRDDINPEDTLNQYVAYIQQKDYDGMYSLTTEDTAREEFVNRNKNIYGIWNNINFRSLCIKYK